MEGHGMARAKYDSEPTDGEHSKTPAPTAKRRPSGSGAQFRVPGRG